MPFAVFRALFSYRDRPTSENIVLGLLLLSVLFIPLAQGAEVELAWDPSPSANVGGYYVLWGTSSDNLSGQTDVGNTTTHTLPGLAENTTYYFTTKAYDSARTTESATSNVVSTTTPYDPPSANFTAANRSGEAPLTVTFNDTSAGNVTSRSWNFGDGGTSTGGTAMYTYSQAGTYNVSLTVDGPGGNDSLTKNSYINVQAPPSDDGSSGSGSGGGDDGSSGSGSGGGDDGLMAAYGFEEQGDVLVQDASGNSNDGIADGPTSISGGKFGRALRFDGVNDWVTVNDSPSLDLTSGMTVEAWVYPTETPTGWQTVVIKEQSNHLVYSLNANSDANQPATTVYIGGGRRLSGGARLQSGEWTHLATTYDGGRQRLYVNGVQVASRAQSGTMPDGSGVLHIGGNNIWDPAFFKGRIDEVRIYNRALSEQEIRDDMDSPVEPGSTDSGTGDSGSGDSGTGAASYQQSSGADGLVSIELENYDAKVAQNAHDWSTVSRSGASGGKAVEATPNTGFNVNTGYVDLSPRMDYSIEFVKTGTHYVWVRGLGSSSSNDSLHVGLNGSPVSTADRISSFNTSWTWSKDTMDGAVARITVPSTGVHTLNVWMREDGMVADRLVLTTNSGYDPDGSAQDGGSTGGGGSTGSGQPAIRINAGGGDYTDSQTNLWQADTGYNTGNAASTTSAIDGTGEDALYQTERWDPNGGVELRYDLPVAPGSYELKLHFAEIYGGAFRNGARVFNVRVEGQTVLTGLDVYARAPGPNKALVETLPVTVTDNTLSIEFIHGTENPKISAIEVLSASGGGN